MARSKGTGSVYKRASDGLWVGTVEAGWTATGTGRRIVVTGRTKTIATQRLRDKQCDIPRNGIPVAGTSSRMTVKTYAETWLARRRDHLKPGAYGADQASVNQWLNPAIGRKRLEALTPADVRAVSQAALNAGRADATAARARSMLAKLLTDAKVDGYDVPQRCFMVEAVTITPSGRRDIPLLDALRVLDVARSWPDSTRWVAALLQGMRQGECLGLMWDHVDVDAGTLTIERELEQLTYKTAKQTPSISRAARRSAMCGRRTTCST